MLWLLGMKILSFHIGLESNRSMCRAAIVLSFILLDLDLRKKSSKSEIELNAWMLEKTRHDRGGDTRFWDFGTFYPLCSDILTVLGGFSKYGAYVTSRWWFTAR